MDPELLRGADPGRTQGKLTGAARHWATARPRAAPDDNSKGSADAFNVTIEGWDRPDDAAFGVWPENWPSVQAFLLVRTQWIRSQGVATGLNYDAVDVVLRRRKVVDADRIFEDLQVMETVIIAEWVKQLREKRR